ncbi:MAG: YeeE/YedE family protein [Flavobacterium sp.]|nr:MAG: YeeE/YedE family protein [Flavobacterium sp.]
MEFVNFISQPWPWYVAGPLIGLTVPALLILGNKTFGISANLRHACAACYPAGISFFEYDWRKEIWNFMFALGIVLSGLFVQFVLPNPNPIAITPALRNELAHYGIDHVSGMMPEQLFSWESIFTLSGFVTIGVGGFMLGFGSRYAGGCTSGHAISGLSNLQFPSLVATCCFFIGGLIMANFLLPLILSL